MHVICHMMGTVNGKILLENWKGDASVYHDHYANCHEEFDSQAWLCGRTTMQVDFTDGNAPKLPKTNETFDREAYVGDENATSFAVALDTHGKLNWDTKDINGDHVITVLTEQVDDAYLEFLRDQSISYVFAGQDEIDLATALDELEANFPIDTVMLEGGGHIDGSMLRAGLIDELSLLIIPQADATPDTPSVFELTDTEGETAAALSLQSVEQLGDDVVWMRYEF